MSRINETSNMGVPTGTTSSSSSVRSETTDQKSISAKKKLTEQLKKPVTCIFCAYKVGDRVMVKYKDIFYPGVLKALPHEDIFNRYKVVCDGDDESTTYTLCHKIKRQTSIEDENTGD